MTHEIKACIVTYDPFQIFLNQGGVRRVMSKMVDLAFEKLYSWWCTVGGTMK